MAPDQRIAHEQSLSSPTQFWDTAASAISWATPYTAPLTFTSRTPSKWTWFPGGRLSASYNLLGRHVEAGFGSQPALIWESPVTSKSRTVSYEELLGDVVVLAGVLGELGVKEGDTVLVYMPMCIEAVVAMLACTHLGAVHSVVFGGFAPGECAKRIESARPEVVLTASCGVEGKDGKSRVIPYLPFVREAIDKSAFKPSYTVLLERDEFWQPVDKAKGELQWKQLVKSYRARHCLQLEPKTPPPTPITGLASPTHPQLPSTPRKLSSEEYGAIVDSQAPHYIIYTSGTTGTPKGVLRAVGGHLVGLSYTTKNLFNINRSDVLFTASDIGWVVGHSFCVYAPLLVGATSIIYEGKPVGTPDAAQFWRICASHSVNALFTAPSALRAIARQDPEGAMMARHKLRSLRGLFLAGERSEPKIITHFQDLLKTLAAPSARVVDNWWSSESGSPMTGIFLDSSDMIKPGLAGLPLPGFDLRIVDDDGRELPAGSLGNVVLKPPLAPTGLSGLYQSPNRFWNSYFKRFHGRWIDTGDAGRFDSDGYLEILARTDDILNVAAHRLSTGAIEGALLRHPDVLEAYVVAGPDEMKGEVPVAFVVLGVRLVEGEEKQEKRPLTGDDEKAMDQLVRKNVGPIASLKGVVEIGPDAVPRTRSGKVLRRELKALVEGKVVAVPEGVNIEQWGALVERVRARFVEGRIVKAKL